MGMPLFATVGQPKSRRALLTGALGGMGAWAASTIGRANPVQAESEIVHVGDEFNTAASVTRLRNPTNNATVFQAESTHGGIGVVGSSNSAWGVVGFGVGPGGSGVAGTSNEFIGVRGVGGSGGAGVDAQNFNGGLALHAEGRIGFSTSGVVTIPAGSTGKTVNPGVNVTSGSFVLLTPKANIGSRALWFTTNPTGDTFRIRMSSSRSSGTKVAWLLLG